MQRQVDIRYFIFARRAGGVSHDHGQRHGDCDTQEHQVKAGHGLVDGDCGRQPEMVA